MLIKKFCRQKEFVYANFKFVGVYPTLTIFHLLSSLSLHLPHQLFSEFRSLTNQRPPFLNQSALSCFNVTNAYAILFYHPFL